MRTSGVLVAAMAALVLGPSAASASTSAQRNIQQVVTVVGNGSSVTLDRHFIQTGSITFRTSTTNSSSNGDDGSTISLFRPSAGHTLANIFADLQEEFSQKPAVAAKGTRDLVRDALVYGLADVTKGFPEVVTRHLNPGTYYLMDLGNQPKGQPLVQKLTVGSNPIGFRQYSNVVSQTFVQATRADRFIAPHLWPHQGTYTFTNTSDTIHFMSMIPVKDGTNDAQVQAAFSGPPSNGPPPFFKPGPSGGNDVVSPGRTLQVSYNLPPGAYVLVCFISDDMTGKPHAIMGMHKVIRLT